MSKNLMSVVLCATILSGCGGGIQGEIEDAIRNQVADKESFELSESLLDEDSDIACATFRARNQYGGYVSASAELYSLPSGQWKVSSLESADPKDVCSYFFLVLDAQEYKRTLLSVLGEQESLVVSDNKELQESLSMVSGSSKSAIADFDKSIDELKEKIRNR